MTREALGRIWGVLGTFLAVYTFNAWSKSQGGPALGEVLLLDSRPRIASLYAFFVIAVLLALLAFVGTLHARRSQGSWVNRLPLVGFAPEISARINRKDRSVLVYQLASLVIFVVLPALSLVHLGREVLSEAAIWNRHRPESAGHAPTPMDVIFRRLDERQRSLLFENDDRGRRANLRLANGPEDAAHAAECRAARDGASCAEPARSDRVTQACREDASLCDGVEWCSWGTPIGMGIVASLALLSVSRLFLGLAGTPKST